MCLSDEGPALQLGPSQGCCGEDWAAGRAGWREATEERGP